MRTLSAQSGPLSHEHKEFEFALGFDPDSPQTQRTASGADPTVQAFEQLEELCKELELELQGTQSPAYRVTLPMRDRTRVNIPMDAAFFTFIYPLTPWSSRRRASMRGSS